MWTFFLNYLVTFYLNNMANLHTLTSHGTPSYTHKWRTYHDHRFCDVISPYGKLILILPSHGGWKAESTWVTAVKVCSPCPALYITDKHNCPRCDSNLGPLTTRLHTHPFNGPFSGTTRVIRYQKGKTNLDFTEARDSEWQWHQLGHMQVCTLLQTDNHANNPPLSFYRPDALPAAQPTVSKH